MSPTEIGLVVTDLLVENFPDIFDSQYTARLEEELDEIEEGKEKWTDALAEFYKKFEKDLKYAEKHMENIKRMEKPTDEKCEHCGSPLVIKWGKHGSFYACSTYDKEDPEQLHVHQRKSHQSARPRFRRRAGDDAGRVLRKLRPRDGAEARTLRPVHGLHRISRLQDHAAPRSGQESARHSAGREMPEVRTQHDDSPRPLRRVHVVQRISRVQVREAELHRREVPATAKTATWSKSGRARETLSTDARIIRSASSLRRTSRLPEKCPSCGSEYLVEKNLKAGPVIACPNKECDYERPARRLRRIRSGSQHQCVNQQSSDEQMP